MDPSTQYPSQVQPYDDQSTQAYYDFHRYNQYIQQQQYPYYPQENYTNAHQPSQHQEPTSIHPPGVVPIAPESQTHVHYQHNPYYPQGIVDQQAQQQQWQGSTPEQQWQGSGGGFGPPIGQTPYTGGGRRGGRPYRERGPGHFGSRPNGAGPPFRGRGRGRGRGGHFPAPANNPTAFVQGESSQAPVWPPPRMAWCELCRVDCNTHEILEQHKNGKKHKKSLKAYEDLQKLNGLLVGGQNVQMPVAEVNQGVSIQPEKVETDQNKVDTEQQNVSGEAESAEESARRPGTDGFEGRGRGLKRKMRGGRGGKWMRTYDGARIPVEPPKPKQVIPFVCELCNVKCDSQVVFDTHLAGKKHLSNLKRFQGQQAIPEQAALQALYPALQAILQQAALQALYPPNPNASTSFGIRLHDGGHSSQGLFPQLAPSMFPPGQAPVPGLGTTSASAEPTVLENQGHQDPKPEAEPAATGKTKSENGTSEPEPKEANLRADSSVVEPLDGTVSGAEQVRSGVATDKSLAIPESDNAPSDHVVLAQTDNTKEELESNSKE